MFILLLVSYLLMNFYVGTYSIDANVCWNSCTYKWYSIDKVPEVIEIEW